jgi:ABC-2 type transport system permease protein
VKIRDLKLRIILVTMEMTFKTFLARPEWFLDNTVAPLVFTIVALMYFKILQMQNFTLYAVFGAGVAGMWATTLWGSGNAIEFERWGGTLEYTLVSPMRLWKVVLGRALTYAVLGLIMMAEVMALAMLIFSIPLQIANPVAFLISLIASTISFTVLGMLFATTFVLSRASRSLKNLLEPAAFALCGVMYPVSVLPFWVQLVSFSLSPTWGMETMRATVEQGVLPVTFSWNLFWLMVITLVYLVISWFFFRVVENRARVRGELEKI